jgi:hypothetical protein
VRKADLAQNPDRRRECGLRDSFLSRPLTPYLSAYLVHCATCNHRGHGRVGSLSVRFQHSPLLVGTEGPRTDFWPRSLRASLITNVPRLQSAVRCPFHETEGTSERPTSPAFGPMPADCRRPQQTGVQCAAFEHENESAKHRQPREIVTRCPISMVRSRRAVSGIPGGHAAEQCSRITGSNFGPSFYG